MANKFTTQTYDYINQINKNFWVLTDIFLAMTPAIHMDTFDAMKFLSLAPKRNMLRGGGCFKADFTNFAPPSGGPHFGDTVGYASRSIPFCSSKFRDQASVRMSFAASEYDWVIPFAEGKAPKTMQEAGKIMLSEIKKHLTSINSFQQSVAVNQLKEGSPVLIDLAALTAADHANEPYIPEMITNKQLSQVQTILANLRQNVDNMFFVPAADQYDLIHSQPLDKNFYTTKSDMVANTYKYYGMSTDELKRAGSFYEYAGMKIRKYTSIKTWNVNAQNTIRGPLVFETKPTFYEGTGISYYKATIKNNGASTIYIRPGDLLYYKGDNALCHIDRATKAPVYPLRWCFSVTSQKWIDDNKGYPGSYYEDPTAGVIDFRGTLYDDIAYEVAAGASLEISVRNELVYETSSPESRNNNVNRNLDLNTDEFWIFPTADPNFLFNKGSFFYYNLDMSVLSPHIMDGAQIFCRVRSYLSTCRKQGLKSSYALDLLFNGKLPDFIM